MAEPYPKTKQLARGVRRYRRKVAPPKQWQAIIAAKVERRACRVCGYGGTMESHHLVSRAHGGDDVAENIVPLGAHCHDLVTRRHPSALAALAASLTDSERAYVVGKLGEDGLVRLFGATR